MSRSGFSSLSVDQWQLSAELSAERRSRLSRGPSFERTVERIAREMELLSISREQARRKPGYFRILVTLKVDPSTVDLFHNGARDYRAQYYSSIRTGERANVYALKILARRIVELSQMRPKRTCPPNFVARSIANPDAKLWIHQGHWLRHARLPDSRLFVARWMKQQRSPDAKQRKKARWASLAPGVECRIDIKGAYFRLDGAPLGSLKPGRSSEIHRLGFT